MFFVDGWRPLSDFYWLSINRANYSLIMLKCPHYWYEGEESWEEFLGTSSDPTVELACKQLWFFIDEFVHYGMAAVLTKEGNLVKISSGMFDFFDERNPTGTYLNIELGRIGTGEGPEFITKDGLAKNERWTNLMHPFLGLPVLLPESLYKRFGSILSDEESEEYTKYSSSEEITKRIVDAFDKGKLNSKQLAKAEFAPEIKDLQWRAIWKDASARRPQISKPGPKANN